MTSVSGYFISVWLKFLILLTPFFVLSVFLTLTQGHDAQSRRHLAVRVTVAVIIGPATTGALLVMGAERRDWVEQMAGCGALVASILTVGAMLLLANQIQSQLGQRGLSILSKLTGLALSALAAQMMLTGIRNFLIL